MVGDGVADGVAGLGVAVGREVTVGIGVARRSGVGVSVARSTATGSGVINCPQADILTPKMTTTSTHFIAKHYNTRSGNHAQFGLLCSIKLDSHNVKICHNVCTCPNNMVN